MEREKRFKGEEEELHRILKFKFSFYLKFYSNFFQWSSSDCFFQCKNGTKIIYGFCTNTPPKSVQFEVIFLYFKSKTIKLNFNRIHIVI